MITDEMYLLAKKVIQQYENQNYNKFGLVNNSCKHTILQNPDNKNQTYCRECYSIWEDKKHKTK